MEQLIQTSEASIIYGDFNGEPNQELFRCPRATDNIDIPHYVNFYRALICPMGSEIPFENDDTEDLSNVKRMRCKDYWRMYFRGGWAGRWMGFGDTGIDEWDCVGVNNIIKWLCENFPHGCDWEMQDYFKENFKPWGNDKRFLIKPRYSSIYKVMVDTTYGNGDYPVRIYVYESEE